jgi:hypothetical protein
MILSKAIVADTVHCYKVLWCPVAELQDAYIQERVTKRHTYLSACVDSAGVGKGLSD